MNSRIAGLGVGVLVALGLIAVSSASSERVRPGEWTTTLDAGGHSASRSVCVSLADAAALNGDERSIRSYTERVTARAGCHVSDVKTAGNQVTVTSVCAGGQPNVGTTTYFGDRSETVNSSGARASSRWVGACQ